MSCRSGRCSCRASRSPGCSPSTSTSSQERWDDRDDRLGRRPRPGIARGHLRPRRRRQDDHGSGAGDGRREQRTSHDRRHGRPGPPARRHARHRRVAHGRAAPRGAGARGGPVGPDARRAGHVRPHDPGPHRGCRTGALDPGQPRLPQHQRVARRRPGVHGDRTAPPALHQRRVGRDHHRHPAVPPRDRPARGTGPARRVLRAPRLSRAHRAGQASRPRHERRRVGLPVGDPAARRAADRRGHRRVLPRPRRHRGRPPRARPETAAELRSDRTAFVLVSSPPQKPSTRRSTSRTRSTRAATDMQRR